MRKIGNISIKLFFISLFFIFASFLTGSDIEFTASVDTEKAGLNDTIVFTVTFKGISNPSQPDISLLSDFRVVQTSRSSEFKFINGVSSSYINFIYYLSPSKEGLAIIPPLKYVYNGTEYKTPKFEIIVVKGSLKKVAPRSSRRSIPDFDFSPFTGSGRSRPREIDIQLKAFISKNEIKVGEQLIYTVKLYSRNKIDSVNMISRQTFPGFWHEWYPVPVSIDGGKEVIDGKSYQVYEIRKAALFPGRKGILKIPPLRFEFSLARDSFSFFSNPEKVIRATQSIRVKVKELTEAGRDLPTGKFNLIVKTGKKTIDINDIFTLTVIVRGSGNIKTLNIPEFKSNDDFKVFPSKISRDINFEKNGIFGAVKAEVPISFKNGGEISFPSLKFLYYDTSLSKVIIKESSPFTVFVSGKRDSGESSIGITRTGVQRKGEDIDFIKRGSISDQEKYLHYSGLYSLLFIIPFIFSFILFFNEFVIKKYLLKNKLFNRKINLQRTSRDLKNVNNYGDIFQVLETYLQDKTGIGKSLISNRKAEEILYSSNVGKQDREKFLRIWEDSELSRFSPNTIKSISELKKDINALIDIIKRIDGKIK
ncbi:MAG: BatD family protein [Acidobacteriota bacterium]